MNLALFDLDHTLIPTDSDHEWGRFLVRLGVVDEVIYRQKNDEFYGHYKAGTLDIQAFLRFALAPLAANPRDRLDAMRGRFMHEVIDPVITPQARALVYKHLEAGDLCAVVTATNSFVTAPIAAAFGIKHLIATEPATVDGTPEGQFTGEVEGVPSFREGKITRVEAWLKAQGAGWDNFENTTFYSDSANDLPLLEKVSEPVATNPDDRLRHHAAAAGWRIMDLF
ncbi:HAD family hydrolase [Cupriavidus taiwanensis]|uniref:histidinol-phosphatase n=1 Tax=Cupriavidus taiwanensis TaxID=164546 RepID=UPI000E101F65|nr:HAD family hydrolase [Cupriavidus taiwanensis]SOY50336.1 putative Phosphoserine phosphatase [Cupriavidus taiwanensis]SOY50405.1 putative Phosphoserine phosphatase [Cupriavidus taiwanensis]SOY83568.1 putative Phosphoserine phosphatase [Cupriavidus taiwanensis]SOZ57603.1 putative Phosphoserine phosphatase [Cupriavidus taiwanensis]SOZ79557.1 putative Phosphoserine phosphatase [Cupriavidus taiwanensis]